MSKAKYCGGCAHHPVESNAEPIDNHTCHCSVCKRVTGQPDTHVAFFKHGELKVGNVDGLKRVPFNDQNPHGPLELCMCKECNTPIMLDDKVGRIRVAVPNIMGYGSDFPKATYHAFFDPAAGVAKPSDGRAVQAALRPDFAWPRGHIGGCKHHATCLKACPIDNHTCHCSVCKRVTGQPNTHVVFVEHGELAVDNANGLKRVPFNDQNPNGPLELCMCKECNTPIMLDDKERRIHAVVPNIMGFGSDFPKATYHAFFDPGAGHAKPSDGLDVQAALRKDFVWPAAKAARL